MAGILQQEWLNQNAGRAYPFEENMARIPKDANGNLIPTARLPNYVIVDLIFTMPDVGSERLYLSQLAAVGNLLTMVLSRVSDGQTVAAVTVDRLTHVANTSYAVAGINAWFDARGWITIGDLRNLDRDLAEGLYNYESSQTLFEARTVRPALRGVRSLRTVNLNNVSDYLYGHVALLAGDNIRLEYDESVNGIWINAEPNAGYKEACDCESAVQTNLVRTINGIPLQDVVLVGDGECVEVKTSGNKIIISDKCSEPCCGCPELDFLTETLKIVETSLNRIEEYANSLSDRLTTFITNYVLTVGR